MDTRFSIAMDEARDRNWSSLPSDIVFIIKSLLLARDRMMFNCVCRAWKSVPTTAPHSPIRLIDPSRTLSKTIKFPLLMFMGRDNSVCNFYHAVDYATYTLDVPEIGNATIRYSKDGWLLMCRSETEFFFFNPITKDRINLPPFELHSPFYSSIAFSSIPTSSDCVVLALNDHGYFKNSALEFAYIRKGDDSWTAHELPHKGVDFVTSYCNPIYHKGIFYCLGMKGNLVKFDPKEEDPEKAWIVLPRPNKPCNSSRRNYLIECGGELLSVFEGRAGEFIEIFKLNQSLMSWKKVTNLGEETLVVSLTSAFAVASEEAQALGLRNTIFFPRFRDKQHSVFYSLFTSRFHCLTLDHASSKDFYGTTEKLRCCWIQPNFEKHSEEELQWHS